MALEEPSPEQASDGASWLKGRTGKMPEQRRWFVENKLGCSLVSEACLTGLAVKGRPWLHDFLLPERQSFV